MTQPGWYKDARNPELARWHDGTGWTEHTMVMADWKGPGQPPPPQAAWQAPVASQSRQDARADAASARAREKAMRPWYRKKRFLIPLALAVVIVIAAVASGGGGKDNNVTASSDATGSTTRSVNASGSHPAADDVSVTSCENQGYGLVKIGVTVTNHTSKTSNYIVSLAVNDSSGTKVGDGTAATNDLAAGATANLDASGTASSAAKGAISCVVSSVTRYASG